MSEQETTSPKTAEKRENGGVASTLTEPQIELLRRSAQRPIRVVRGYKPAEKLAALGYVEIAITEGPYPWIVAAVTAGEAALAKSSHSPAAKEGE